METTLIKQYKGIDYFFDRNLSLLGISVDKNNISNDDDFVSVMPLFLELAEIIQPRYVVFDKRNSEFEITPALFLFARNNVMNVLLKSIRVKKIFFISELVESNGASPFSISGVFIVRDYNMLYKEISPE